MNVAYDGTDWFTGVDIAGVTKLTSMQDGKLPQWQQGRGVDASGNLSNALAKTAAMNSNGSVAWSLSGGKLPGNGGIGGIHKRIKGPGNRWQLITQNYTGTPEGTIGDGLRPVGHRRIYHDTATNAVYVCCQRVSNDPGSAFDYNGGIARSVGGGPFTDFKPANGFTIGRMYRAVIGSAVGYSDLIYACADNQTGNGSTVGNKPCVALYSNASGNATFVQLDTIGTGNPGGLSDCKTMMCINEGGNDSLYVVVGEGDATNGGLWRCTINGDPTTAGWQSSPSLTWTKLNNGTLAAGHQYRTIAGKRVGNATYIMVGNTPSGTGSTTPQLSGSIPGTSTVTKYEAAIYRSLNAHTNTPTWTPVTNDTNISPAGVFNPMFGSNNETWTLLTQASDDSSIKCALGGPQWVSYDMDADPVNDVVVVAGKSGSWITQNPWAANNASVKWQPFSNQTGGVINTSVWTHPFDNKKWTMSDVDRGGYFNIDGAAGQMHGIERYNGTRAHSNYIRQGGDYPGLWLLGNDNNTILCSMDWATTTDLNVLPTITNDSVTTATLGILVAVAEFTYAGNQYRLAVDTGQNSLHLKVRTGAWNAGYNNSTWTKVYNFGTVNSTSSIICNDGFKDFWVLIPESGLFYFPDVTNITSPSTVSMFPVSVNGPDSDFCGRVDQDASNRNILYVTWGNALKGLWKVTGANNITISASGTKLSGTGTVTRITNSVISATTAYGSVSVDPANNNMIVYTPTYNGTPDIALFDGAIWRSIADDTFVEVSGQSTWVTLRGDRIYTGQVQAGTPYAIYG